MRGRGRGRGPERNDKFGVAICFSFEDTKVFQDLWWGGVAWGRFGPQRAAPFRPRQRGVG